ncbi:chlorhexidine efflux transporter [Erwinia sp. 198]|uniref:chlorhexidine efflux transporter n=1 Tax=Erwinia sp. 198 TaxID=2022746 RepID=UPI000F65DD12|nr:chlorhexidine efflux transporter [Erwinia sp. 198]RRZ90290.1 hypothetical protein EGK14_13930 [Erwinia sp. 198]
METVLNKTLKERVFHSILFEVVANAPIALVLAARLAVPATQSVALAKLYAITAMLSKVIFNRLFDAVQIKSGFRRSLPFRILHAVLFEAGLLAVPIPITPGGLPLIVKSLYVANSAGCLLFALYRRV